MDTAKQFLIASLESEVEAARKRATRCRLLADYVVGGKIEMMRLAANEDQTADLYEKMVKGIKKAWEL
jgi:hypothetical protein